jgi:hypothetical protein
MVACTLADSSVAKTSKVTSFAVWKILGKLSALPISEMESIERGMDEGRGTV